MALNRANEMSLATRKLPLDRHVCLRSSKVLTIINGITNLLFLICSCGNIGGSARDKILGAGDYEEHSTA